MRQHSEATASLNFCLLTPKSGLDRCVSVSVLCATLLGYSGLRFYLVVTYLSHVVDRWSSQMRFEDEGSRKLQDCSVQEAAVSGPDLLFEAFLGQL